MTDAPSRWNARLLVRRIASVNAKFLTKQGHSKCGRQRWRSRSTTPPTILPWLCSMRRRLPPAAAAAAGKNQSKKQSQSSTSPGIHRRSPPARVPLAAYKHRWWHWLSMSITTLKCCSHHSACPLLWPRRIFMPRSKRRSIVTRFLHGISGNLPGIPWISFFASQQLFIGLNRARKCTSN